MMPMSSDLYETIRKGGERPHDSTPPHAVGNGWPAVRRIWNCSSSLFRRVTRLNERSSSRIDVKPGWVPFRSRSLPLFLGRGAASPPATGLDAGGDGGPDRPSGELFVRVRMNAGRQDVSLRFTFPEGLDVRRQTAHSRTGPVRVRQKGPSRRRTSSSPMSWTIPSSNCPSR